MMNNNNYYYYNIDWVCDEWDVNMGDEQKIKLLYNDIKNLNKDENCDFKIIEIYDINAQGGNIAYIKIKAKSNDMLRLYYLNDEEDEKYFREKIKN